MTALALVVKTIEPVCPICGGPMSLPFPGRRKQAGKVVQHCRDAQHCGHTVWSDAPVVVPAHVDDGSRHGRFQLPVTSEPEPPLIAPNRWTPMHRLARRQLEALNRLDRKLAASGGDR